jgi:hypothetical protein
MERERGIGGRKPIPVEYRSVAFADKDYIVGIVQKTDGSRVPFLFDADDEKEVITRSWHLAVRDKYVASSLTTTEEEKKSLYLHNLVMDKLVFEGKGANETIDHISGNGLDNRKANLRLTSQSLQNHNTKTRKRVSTRIPSTVYPSTIPRNIWYIPPRAAHGERFAVEIKGIPGHADIVWKTSSSKKIKIQEKLDQAIKKRAELFEMYPILKEHARETEIAGRLKMEFQAIVSLVGC